MFYLYIYIYMYTCFFVRDDCTLGIRQHPDRWLAALLFGIQDLVQVGLAQTGVIPPMMLRIGHVAMAKGYSHNGPTIAKDIVYSNLVNIAQASGFCRTCSTTS